MLKFLVAQAGAAAMLNGMHSGPPRVEAAPPSHYGERYPALAHEILRQFIDTDTTHAKGSTDLARLIAARAIAAGYPWPTCRCSRRPTIRPRAV